LLTVGCPDLHIGCLQCDVRIYTLVAYSGMVSIN